MAVLLRKKASAKNNPLVSAIVVLAVVLVSMTMTSTSTMMTMWTVTALLSCPPLQFQLRSQCSYSYSYTSVTAAAAASSSSSIPKNIPVRNRHKSVVLSSSSSSSSDNTDRRNKFLYSSSPDDTINKTTETRRTDGDDDDEEDEKVKKNTIFIMGLMENNLMKLCDTYICTGSSNIREQIFRVVEEIANLAIDKTLVNQSIRMVKRAGVPMHKTYLEKYQIDENGGTSATTTTNNKLASSKKGGKSALSRRMNGKRRDLLTSSVINTNIETITPASIGNIVKDQNALRTAMANNDGSDDNDANERVQAQQQQIEAASIQVSKILAQAGTSDAFNGQNLGVGGLDDVLVQIKRRIWTPLAAPPQLLQELGISPARGLLLYGKPGCGKSLIASVIGQMLSPFRPITVISGPEILDKFVGSSEKNLRNVFDNPPDIYPKYRSNKSRRHDNNSDDDDYFGAGSTYTDDSDDDDVNNDDEDNVIANAALHVIVMDEFDAVARSRGGSDGKGGQGDAGVARDSVVNQLLAKMDGVQPLVVPTLVIGLTNKRSLIEPALLRPGRFEVQIEIPPPKTTEQRVSIFKIHTKNMLAAGRLQVNDPPSGTTAERLLLLKESTTSLILSYDDLLLKLAQDSDGFSGAAIAGVARAAASHALERAVEEQQSNSNADIMNCLVTQEDFYDAIDDVRGGMGNHDHTDEDDDDDDNDDDASSDANKDDKIGDYDDDVDDGNQE